METILTSRLLFDGEDRPVEGGRYGMVEMTSWRVRMLGHVAKGAGREIGLTAKSPAYSRKGMLELAADGSILAGRETLARLSRTVDEEVESVPVLLRTVDADDRTLRACRLDIGDRFAERYIDPLVTDEFPGLKDAHNVICAVRAYINWEDFGMDGMVHRKGWPASSTPSAPTTATSSGTANGPPSPRPATIWASNCPSPSCSWNAGRARRASMPSGVPSSTASIRSTPTPRSAGCSTAPPDATSIRRTPSACSSPHGTGGCAKASARPSRWTTSKPTSSSRRPA